MMAMVQEEYGPATEVLHPRQVPIPGPDADEVLVRVHSSSVNAMEWHLMNGKPYVFRAVFGFRPRTPTLGADVSGTVVATGEKVTRFQPGDAVFGEIHHGGYAEYAVAKEEFLAAKPSGVSFEDTAAIGVAGLTALQGLRDVAGLKAGDRVLINGASGGVGTYAIQIAKVLGAEVTAVCSTRNVEQARRLGADHVVDYQREDITKSGKRFDVMFDLPGNHSLRDCKRLLAAGGTYVMVGGPKGNWTGPLFRLLAAKLLFLFSGESEANFTAASRREDLETLGEMLDSGQIDSVIEDRFFLRDIGIPLDRQGEFHARAKTVIAVQGGV
jgi:NADPH:quinone reductase-like Zn-dependent oxidoreductase